MANFTTLEGENYENALAMLKDVTDILEGFGIRYWLECGTLLGVIREGRLLPWDTDIDLYILAEDVPLLRKAFWKLFFKGYRAKISRMKVDHFPLKKGAPRIAKVRNRDGLFHRGPLLIDIFIKHAPGDGFLYNVLMNKNECVVQKAPSEMLAETTLVDFGGKQYPVPAKYDEYLTYRYGDWRTPVKEWSTYENDQSNCE